MFSRGYGRRITNVFTGKFNLVPVTVMDYKYTTGSGKDSHTWKQTVMVMDCEKRTYGLHPIFLIKSAVFRSERHQL